MKRGGWSIIGLSFVAASACGGSRATSAQSQVVLCPAGTVLDPQKTQCVAMQGVEPVVPVETATVAIAAPSVTAPLAASASASPVVTATATASAPPPPPPPASGFAIDVRCTFPQGWVALLPASQYPKDESFLMQSLIGLTKEPSFWNGTEYRGLRPYAAKRCTSSYTRLLAPTAGSYYLLAGEEGTFDARGAYDKNGVKRQLTVNASTAITIAPSDLVHTWLCISCPWIVMRDGDGRDQEPFVVLANRRGVASTGTDEHRVRAFVHGGRVVLRVIEIEHETTHLSDLALRVENRTVRAESLARALEIDRGKQVTLSFVVGGEDREVDASVVATGYYDPK